MDNQVKRYLMDNQQYELASIVRDEYKSLIESQRILHQIREAMHDKFHAGVGLDVQEKSTLIAIDSYFEKYEIKLQEDKGGTNTGN